MDFILDVTAQGLAYSILAIGVLLTYQVLDYADLTVEGSFPLGAAAGAMCVMHGINPFLSLIVAFIAGLAAGYATGFLHVKFGISSLLSGILVMTGLYSINLIVAGDMSNIPLFTYDTIFSYGALLGNSAGGSLGTWIVKLWPIFILLVLVLFLKLLMDWFLDTKYGFLMRIAGDNPQLIATLGKDIGHIKMNGLAISNGYAAVSGAVVSQFLKYFDITLGTGMIVGTGFCHHGADAVQTLYIHRLHNKCNSRCHHLSADDCGCLKGGSAAKLSEADHGCHLYRGACSRQWCDGEILPSQGSGIVR